MKTTMKASLLATLLVLVSFELPAQVQASAPPIPADLAVLDANILTMDSTRPRAEAFAVRRGEFAVVGSIAAVRAVVGPATTVLDLDGKTVAPGFNDAHCHPHSIYPPSSPHASVDVSPRAVSTIDELVAALRAKARLLPEGSWVRGSRYQDTKLGRHPTRRDLDRVSTTHFVYISHSSGHIGVFNSLAMQRAKITRQTKNPGGGSFDRDSDGKPDGVCRESARSMVLRRCPRRPSPGREERLDGLLRCFDEFASHGITSVTHAGISPSRLRLYQDALARGLKVRVYALISSSYLDEVVDAGLRTGFGNDRLRIGGIKVFHGNSLSGRTCWLYEPYAHDKSYFGIPPRRSQETLDGLIAKIHDAGFQACVHSNGDREIDMVLDAFESALKKSPRQNHRHRIEHGSVVNARILARMKKLGIVYVPHSYIHEHGDKMEAYGKRRWNWMHANRSALELGIPVAGNSDYPVSAAHPMLRIQSLVTRRSAEGKVYGKNQRLSVEQALRVFTLGSAYGSFEEERKGSITVGKLADFVVLSADPRKVDPGKIGEIEVLRTYIGGKAAFLRQR